MKAKKPVLLALAILALVSVVVALGACSEDATEAMVGETQSPTATSLAVTTSLETTMALPQTTAAPQTTMATAASTSTTAFSSSMTTEPPAGAIILDNGNVQVEGYMLDVYACYLLDDGGPFLIHLIPTPLLTAEEYEAAILQELYLPPPDPREASLEFLPTTTFTVSTLGEGGEQDISLDEFLSIWSASPPEGGEHLAYTLWSIEYGEDSKVVSITEVAP